MPKPTFVSRLASPFRSRKFRVALATVIASIAAAWGFELREDIVHTILGVGAAMILGIAHEDHGRVVLSAPIDDATPPPAEAAGTAP